MPNLQPLNPSRKLAFPDKVAPVAVSFAGPPAVEPSRPGAVRLDQMLARLEGQTGEELKWTLAKLGQELGQEAPALAEDVHRVLLERIDALEQQGVRSRKGSGEQPRLYGRLMDLYHLSRALRDGYSPVYNPSLPQGSARPTLGLP